MSGTKTHRKNDSTCDETALLRGQSHSRESSGASNLSVKFTVTPDCDGGADGSGTAASIVTLTDETAPPSSSSRGVATRTPAVSASGSHYKDAASTTVPPVSILKAPTSGGAPSSPQLSSDRMKASGRPGGGGGHRKKRLRPEKQKSGKPPTAASSNNSPGAAADGDSEDEGGDGGYNRVDPDEIRVVDVGSRLQNGTCDTHDTPNTYNDGMLQNGDSKSHNSDYGSFHAATHANPANSDNSGGYQRHSRGEAATSSAGGQPPGGVSSKSKAGTDQVDHQSAAMATDQRQPLLDNSPADSGCSDDDAGVSSGYTRRKTRLHQRPSNDRPVRIEMGQEEDEDGGGGGGGSGGNDSLLAGAAGDLPIHIPGEPCKTFVAFIFLFFAWVATTTSLALTHDRVPDRPPLPDIILDNVTYQHWGLDVSEYIILISTWGAFLVCIFHKHRCVVLRRVFIMVGLHYYYRAITMFVTVLPVADEQYKCAPQLNSTEITAGVIATRVIKLLSGFGLSINGEHVYCGDYIYSGHTMTLVMGYLVVKAYSPKRWFLLHYASFCLSFAGILFLVLARGHYSIDVVIAYWITTRVWYIYHTMSNNGPLLKDSRNSRNYFKKMWWWYMFYYFECNVPVTVPREYNLPIPNRVLRLKPIAWIINLCTSDSPPSTDKREEPDATGAPGGGVESVSSEVARQDRNNLSDMEAGRSRATRGSSRDS